MKGIFSIQNHGKSAAGAAKYKYTMQYEDMPEAECPNTMFCFLRY